LIRVTDRQTLTPEVTAEALKQLQEVARLGGNVFEELMEPVKVASLGQITDALFNGDASVQIVILTSVSSF